MLYSITEDAAICVLLKKQGKENYRGVITNQENSKIKLCYFTKKIHTKLTLKEKWQCKIWYQNRFYVKTKRQNRKDSFTTIYVKDFTSNKD